MKHDGPVYQPPAQHIPLPLFEIVIWTALIGFAAGGAVILMFVVSGLLS